MSFSEINVAPFVDVMLVLLIVFMVAAPMMSSSGIEIDLPREPQKAIQTDAIEPLSVNIDERGRVFLQETTEPLEDRELMERLKAIVSTNPEIRVVIRADRTLAYERIMSVLSVVGSAGIVKVALLSEVR